MARIEGEGGSAARGGTKSGTKDPAASPIRHISGVYQTAQLRRGNAAAAGEPPGTEAPAADAAPEARRAVPLRRECDSRTLVAMLRLLGIGAAALAMSGAYPDDAEEPERRWDVTVDIRPASASAITAVPLVEIRTAFDEPGLYVDGHPVHAGPDELQLLQLLLHEPGSWWAYHLVEKRIWPGQTSNLENRRRNLFWRVNQKLDLEVKAALARRGQTRPPDAPKLIQSRTGRVRFNLHACRGVSQKI